MLNPKGWAVLLAQLGLVLDAYDRFDAKRRARDRPSWIVPTAAIACAGAMYFGWADINRSMVEADKLRANMSPTIYEVGTDAAAAASSSFNFAIRDMDYAGLSGDTLVLQGFPMPKGAIDTAYVVDSVEVLVNGAEVGAYVEHRGLAYSDGSARVIFTQFRADPSTETTGSFCYSGCTVDSTRITEVSWTTSDTTYAAINSGDSTGIRTGFNGYHPVMAFATDSAWLSDAYFLPLATIEEVQGITGTAALAADTLLQRLQDYGDLVWDSTQSARITGTPPAGTSYTAISILTDASVISGMTNCEDWSNSATSFELYRKAAGQSNNSTCRSGQSYYDWPKTLQQYGMMRHADSVGVEFIRRGIAISWQDLLNYRGANCWSGNINRRGVMTGLAGSYYLTGDSAYFTQIDCNADKYGTGLRWGSSWGDDNDFYGEPRWIAFATDVFLAAHLVGSVTQDWGTKLDTAMAKIVNGSAGTPAYAGGIWALDSAASSCTGAYSQSARPTNSLMIPLVVRSMMAVKHVKESWQFVVGVDTTDVPTTIQAVADTMGIDKALWQDSTSAYANFFSGNACSDPTTWTLNAHDIAGIHIITAYADYATDTLTATLNKADSLLQRVGVSEVATTDFSSKWDVSGIRDYILAEYFNNFLEAMGLRQCTLQADC